MPLDIPTNSQEVIDRSKTDVQRSLPNSNPFLPNSVLGALVTASASRVYDFYIQLGLIPNHLLPDTSESEFQERWSAIYGKQRLAATTSQGNAIATGSLGSVINLGTTMASSDGSTYQTTATVSIVDRDTTISSLVRSGSIVTAITSDTHSLSNNTPVDIAGATEPEYNGTGISIEVLSTTSFSYTIVGSPSTPATGTPVASYQSAVVPVVSQDFQNSGEGVNVNQSSGSTLSLQGPLVGIDNDLLVDAGGVEGGSDQETFSQLRIRTLDKIRNPTYHFNSSDIIEKAKEVNGVTRVFVEETTPSVGQVTIYFMRDNDDSPLPSGSEISSVKEMILTIKPAASSDDDIIVLTPTPVVVPFTFTALSPDTPQMRSAVTANLQQLFAETTEVGESLDQDAYRAAIQNTIDIETGDTIKNFELSTPTGDVTISSGEIGVLGGVTYP